VRHPFLRTLAGSAATPTDPNFENVTLLLHGDGTNGGQNNSFVDGSTNNFTITRNGNTTQGTFSPYGDNWANYFDGTGDYLTAPAGSSFAYGTGDFTIEGWFYATSEPVQYGSTIFSQTVGGTNYFWCILGDATVNNPNPRKVSFVFATSGGGTTISSGATTFNLNSWNHFAIVRSSGSVTVYLNGVGGTAVSCTQDFTNTTYVPTIGRYTHTNSNLFTGYLSNLRVLKGTAQYTANFTPSTTPLTAITNTSLLTCQSNRFRDASTNNFTITRNGDVSVQRFSPFSPTAAYAAGTIGGSGYFDGTGDYLRLAPGAAFAFGTGDFTVELWVYPVAESTSTNGGIYLIDARNASQTTAWLLGTNLAGTAGNAFVLGWSDGSTDLISTGTLSRTAWNHVVYSRSGTTGSLFLNGTRVGTKTDSKNYSVSPTQSTIGSRYDGSLYQTNGYISNIRTVKGTAVYDPTQTTLTVPTSPLTAITNTSLLLNFQNAAILDNAMMAVPETVGNAQIDTTTKKYGTGSMEFDGTGDWLLVPDSIDQRLGTGTFTIECWLYLSATGTARGVVGKGTSTTGWLLSTNTSNAVVFTYGTSTITSTGTLSGTTWYHIAVVREGTGTNQTKIYIGGTNDGTGTVSTDFTQTNAAYVGANRTGGDPMNGYIDDLRITKGVARYTANFTAPTAAFPDL
jgi:hypothetical protein